MTESAKKLFEEAMKLSPVERERLAQQLLESTAAANDDMAREELAELKQAFDDAEDEIANGRVVGEAEVWKRLRAIG